MKPIEMVIISLLRKFFNSAKMPFFSTENL